jgi:predicted Fe-Mo cluster-binding NifX family protein
MKIALPLQQGRFSSHFGGAEKFMLLSVDVNSGEITDREVLSPPEHGRGVFPAWLRQQGASVILAGGMGPRAADIFAQNGIEVVFGVREEDPEAVVSAFLDGTLETSGELCHEHGYHDCGHDHGKAGGSNHARRG